MYGEKVAIRGWKDDNLFCAVAKHSVKLASLVLGAKNFILNKLLVIEEGIRK